MLKDHSQFAIVVSVFHCQFEVHRPLVLLRFCLIALHKWHKKNINVQKLADTIAFVNKENVFILKALRTNSLNTLNC